MIKTLSFLVMIGFMALNISYAQDEIENMLANGGFEDGVTAPWSTYGDATMEVVKELKKAEIDEDPIEGDFCLHVTVNSKGVNFWSSGLQHQGHVFEKGKKYTLAAFLKSDDNFQINFKPELGQDPWTGYGARSFTMTNVWQEYHITTPVMTADVNPATITFHIAYNAGEFWIDGVRFYEGDYVPSDLLKEEAVQPLGKLATVWGRMKAE